MNVEIDLIVTDLHLPNMPGEELISIIKRKNPNQKIGIYTGLRQKDILHEVQPLIEFLCFKGDLVELLKEIRRCQ